jgi:hypothetical protein
MTGNKKKDRNMNTTKNAILAIKTAFQKGYRVTTQGDVISPKGIVLRGHVYTRGKNKYHSFGIRYNGGTAIIPTHRMVAYIKYGELALTSDCVRHLDGNGLNNSFDNIEIGTFSDNRFDIPKEKRIEYAKNASKYNIVYDDKKVQDIKSFHDETKSYKKTMEKFGISSKGTLYNILKNR